MIGSVPNPPTNRIPEPLIVDVSPEWATLDRAGQLLVARTGDQGHGA
jgi:hypothetical protein